MKKILTLLWFTICLFLSLGGCRAQCLKLDIMLIGDMSGSVQGNEQFVCNALSTFAQRFELSEDGVKIGVITFDSSPKLVSPLTANKQQLLTDLISIKSTKANGGTVLTLALQSALNQYVTNGRKSYKKVIILISDGAFDDKEESINAIRLFKDTGVIFYGILIKDTLSEPHIMKMLSDQYFESNYENLVEVMKRMDMCL